MVKINTQIPPQPTLSSTGLPFEWIVSNNFHSNLIGEIRTQIPPPNPHFHPLIWPQIRRIIWVWTLNLAPIVLLIWNLNLIGENQWWKSMMKINTQIPPQPTLSSTDLAQIRMNNLSLNFEFSPHCFTYLKFEFDWRKSMVKINGENQWWQSLLKSLPQPTLSSTDLTQIRMDNFHSNLV